LKTQVPKSQMVSPLSTDSVSFEPISAFECVGSTCQMLSGLGSEIRKMFLLGLQKKAQSPDELLIDLSLGNPDLEPPDEVLAAIEHLAKDRSPGQHRYMDNSGFFATRKYVSEMLSTEWHMPLLPDQVFMTAGAAGALQIIMRTLLDPGDEVLVFAPYFSEYAPYAANFGATLRVCPTNSQHLPTAESIEEHLSIRTKLVILNSPNNPCGVSWSAETYAVFFDKLSQFRQKTSKKIHVLSDEPYSKLLFQPSDVAPLFNQYDATWIVRSHSKDLGLAGDRVGYFVWSSALHSQELLGSLRNAARALGQVNASAFFQRLLPLVGHAQVDVTEYQRRILLFTDLFAVHGIPCAHPAGGFFLFPQSPQPDETLFVSKLLQKGVLVVAGKGFGKPGFVRLSLTRPFAELQLAAEIFCETYVSSLHSISL
jgi:aspartate aminotransferase